MSVSPNEPNFYTGPDNDNRGYLGPIIAVVIVAVIVAIFILHLYGII